MTSAVNVMEEEKFNKWYNDTSTVVAAGTTAIALPGANIVRRNGCIACHSLDGSSIVGPSFKGVFGEETTVEVDGDDQQVMVDGNYIRESLFEPNVKVVKGFRPGLMQSYKGLLTDEEVQQITDYLESLR
jgi:cytochrome c oxidase subunit 2